MDSKLKVNLHFPQVSWRKDGTEGITEKMSMIISLNKVSRYIYMFIYTCAVHKLKGKVNE